VGAILRVASARWRLLRTICSGACRRDTMRDLLDMLELDPPQDQDEQDSFQHFSFLYTRYVQICKNLEDRSATCIS
jgi:hypothetical protein